MIQRHRMARLQLALEHQHWTTETWKHVLFSDETKFDIFNSNGFYVIKRPIGTRYKLKYTIPSVKFNGGGMMCWGCFSSQSIGPLVLIDGIMDSFEYAKILTKSMLPYASNNMCPAWLFQQDNDPKHTSGLMMGRKVRISNRRFVRLPGWFRINNVYLLQTPPYSPDCNPIEHLWAHVKRNLRGYNFFSKKDLWDDLEWNFNVYSQRIDQKYAETNGCNH